MSNGKHRKEPQSCPDCGGDGQIQIDHDGSDGPNLQWVRCDACNGTGQQP